MPTFDDIKDNIEREREATERREKNRIQRLEVAARQEQQKKANLQAQRARFEHERWETPDKAYATWEHRARKLVEIANDYATALKVRAESARRTLGSRTFTFYQEERYNSFFTRKVKTRITGVTHTTPLDYSYKYVGDYGYDLGRFQQPTHYQLTARDRTPVHLVRDRQLCHAILKILVPTIAAERIEKGQSALTKCAEFFLRHGPRLKEPGCRYTIHHSYGGLQTWADYDPQSAIEDLCTVISGLDSAVWNITIFNPSCRHYLTEVLEDLWLEGAVTHIEITPGKSA